MRRTTNSADGLLGFPIRCEVPDNGEVLAFEKISGSYTPKSLTALGIAWSAITGTPTTLSGYGITDAQPLDSDLTAYAALATAGIVARTGSGTVATRTITGPAAGITVSNGDGVSANPTLALADDLAAVEGLSGTGIAVRTASNTWTNRTITGTAGQLTVTDGDGVAGNPTLSLPSAITQATAFSISLTCGTSTTDSTRVLNAQQSAAGANAAHIVGVNGSYAASVLKVGSTRAASTAYNLILGSTGTNADGTGGTAAFGINGEGVAQFAQTTSGPAGGSTAARLLLGSSGTLGIYFGSGAPTVSAGKGSIYLRADGSGTTDRAYVNTDGGTTWTYLTAGA